jgi:hypothetical protein
MKFVEEEQSKQGMIMYTKMTESCFDKCVNPGWGGVSCIIYISQSLYRKSDRCRFIEFHDITQSNIELQGFTTKTLNEGERSCIQNCADKMLKVTQRVGFRVGERTAEEALKQEQGK